MTGTFAEIARARRIEALQAMYGDDAELMAKPAPKALRFAPVDQLLDTLSFQDPLRLMAA
ncbi:hypothetical protein C8N43_2117 [Litoreibacter ponti]|uniref:Uncharacterized protein n=1 Tax=Litoreibacter ponti TaxID=1510457 RepID=A0A2T6BN77_9RHOB|nr:hypothetical protein [Litoreibacter ponti]PTX57447.1 hypothetical protein C8N43_2117 [Litoreibacter ponti]